MNIGRYVTHIRSLRIQHFILFHLLICSFVGIYLCVCKSACALMHVHMYVCIHVCEDTNEG